MAVPIGVDFATDRSEWQAFFLAAIVAGFFGAALVFSARGERPRHLRPREAFLMTALGWILCAGFAAVPFWQGSLQL